MKKALKTAKNASGELLPSRVKIPRTRKTSETANDNTGRIKLKIGFFLELKKMFNIRSTTEAAIAVAT